MTMTATNEAKTQPVLDLVQATGLKHIAVIMDGNRRWAKDRGFHTLAGHQAGVASLRDIVRYADDIGLEALTVYAFSTENWKRHQDEVDGLMTLFIQTMRQELAGLQENAVQSRFLGDFTAFSDSLQHEISTMTEETAGNDGLRFQIAMNYGSRAELLNATKILAQRVADGELKTDDIDEAAMDSVLYTHGLPNPDLVIRTGGEYRLSNYLMWQAAYAEIYITETLWPEFTPEELDKAVITFSQRQRRYGK